MLLLFRPFRYSQLVFFNLFFTPLQWQDADYITILVEPLTLKVFCTTFENVIEHLLCNYFRLDDYCVFAPALPHTHIIETIVFVNFNEGLQFSNIVYIFLKPVLMFIVKQTHAYLLCVHFNFDCSTTVCTLPH